MNTSRFFFVFVLEAHHHDGDRNQGGKNGEGNDGSRGCRTGRRRSTNGATSGETVGIDGNDRGRLDGAVGTGVGDVGAGGITTSAAVGAEESVDDRALVDAVRVDIVEGLAVDGEGPRVRDR